MKKIIALSIAFTLFISAVTIPYRSEPVYAADNAKQIIDAIGIMDTDKGSNESGTQKVSRDRFAQMLVNASTQKESVSATSSVSLFSDVKKNNWAAGYIRAAVSQGWMSGYLNGKFKPKQGVTLQEAVIGTIKLLGYSNTDFTGGTYEGYMNLFCSKGLNKNIYKTNTQYLTVTDCYHLFYNLLTATTKSGKSYAETLGYAVDANGMPDYSSVISSGLEGPIVADADWQDEIPFSTAVATFYKDGVVCSQAVIKAHDVIYYSTSLKAVYIYDNKVTGTVEAVLPDYMAPQSVTVSGKTYQFADSAASSIFSNTGDRKVGDVVTLILDKDNYVIDALSIDEYNTTITGVVLATGTHVVESNGAYTTTYYVTLVDAAGNEYQQDYDKSAVSFTEGDITRVTYTGGVAKVSKVTLNSSSLGGSTFSSDGSTLGSIKLASNVKILDLNDTNYISTYTSRLAGVHLTEGTLYYYELNAYDQISQLILNNVTGDLDKYGISTGITFQGSSSSYSYTIGKETGSVATSSLTSFNPLKGPTGFSYTDGTMKKTYSLTEGVVTSIGTNTVIIGNMKYTLADGYYVYQLVNSQYVLTTLDKVSDLSKFSVKAYYDKEISYGGRIRIIVAESK